MMLTTLPRRFVLAIVAAISFVIGASSVRAQLPTTELLTIYPPGGQKGTSLEVTVAGANQDDLRAIVFSHPGITSQPKMTPPAEFYKDPTPVPGVLTVTIASDVPPGVYEARAVGRFGASNPRPFVVGTLPEIQDDGSNQSLATAKEVTIGTTVNGRADANAVNYFKFILKAGQRVICDCQAASLDSRMNGSLVIFDAKGKELAAVRDSIGLDPALDFTAPADGGYVLAVFDQVFGGGAEFPYRLSIRDTPVLDFIFPPAGVPGSSGPFTVYGRLLPGGQPAEGLTIDGRPLQKLVTNIALPPADQAMDGFALGSSLSPAGAVLDGMEHRLENSSPFRIGFAPAPVVLEQEPNDAARAQQVAIPCEIAGQFYPARDADFFRFDAKKGEVFWIDVISHRLGVATDPVLTVQRITKNDKGEEQVAEIATVDDPGDRPNKVGTDFDFSTDDPSYRFAVPEDGTYRLKLRDAAGTSRNDPRAVYRLQIRPENPDFRLIASAKQLKVPDPNQVLLFTPVVRRGETTLIEVTAQRLDGFAGDIDLSVEGLPPGVTCQGAFLSTLVPSAYLVLTADENAAAASVPIRIVGKAKVGAADVIRKARFLSVVWGTANRTLIPAQFRATRDLMLSVVDKELGPALVQVGDGAVLETSKGGKLDLPIKLTRRGEFKEKIVLTAVGLPNELKPADVTVEGDKNDGTLAITIANSNAKPGVYSFMLRTDTKAKLVRNADAIASAEADQKMIGETVTAVGEELKKATADKDVAVKAAQDATAAGKQAEEAKKKADEAAKVAGEAAKQAAAKLAADKEALNKDPNNQTLKDAAAASEKANQEADAKAKAAVEEATKAAKVLEESQVKAKAADESKVKAEQKFNEVTEKNKRVAAAKQAIDARLAETKKQNDPKDVNLALYSTPIRLRVVESPLKVAAQVPGPLKAKEKIEIPVSLERLYGFAEQVELTLEVPGGVQGLTPGKFSLPAGQKDAKLELAAAEKPTAGDHTLTLRAKAKFNNVDVQATQTIVVKVVAE